MIILNTVNRKTEFFESKASSTVQLHHARNKTKAEVYLVNRNGSRIVFKDYSKRNILIRLFYGVMLLPVKSELMHGWKVCPVSPGVLVLKERMSCYWNT